jgi:hypothetical protein
MAKLYWRVKKNGKWTWVAAVSVYDGGFIGVEPYQSEDEEE